MMDQHAETYRTEAQELLAELESALLELEEHPDDAELVGRVFRAMHTIKGSGAMFGFDRIATFTHEVETVFDLVRNGAIPVTNQLVNLTLAARDRIREMLDENSDGPVSAAESEIVAGLRSLVPVECQPGTAGPDGRTEERPDSPADAPSEVTYRIRFLPHRGIMATGTNPLSLLNELRDLGICTVAAHSEEIPPLAELDPECCYTGWDVILTTNQGEDAIRDVFIFVEDDCALTIEVIADGDNHSEESVERLGEILVRRGDITTDELKAALGAQKRIGEILVDSVAVAPSKVASALAEQQHLKTAKKETGASIRVPADRLDQLVNLVGEMVTVQARLSQTALLRHDTEILAIAEEVERLTSELRDNVLNIRMLPIGSTFSTFKRLVRDLSAELGKQIELTTAGAETELDKTVLEKLNDPLVHIIRNSIDHGIESPEERAAAGKPRQGSIHLSAEHSGDSVLLSITDDGAGLDRDTIRAKAAERGLIPAGVELTDREIFAQIFAAGFSTAKQVTSVSGRGVGMDVVKKAIDALRGSIEIGSERGKGTTIEIRLPLTLAIIESLLVRVGSGHFVLPLSIVDECVELTREDVRKAHGRNVAPVRGHIVPYVPLRRKFSIPGEPPEVEQIVITRVNGERVGFVVDTVIGEHQTVINSLGPAYRNVSGLSGATILGDGNVALILDIPQLVQTVELESMY